MAHAESDRDARCPAAPGRRTVHLRAPGERVPRAARPIAAILGIVALALAPGAAAGGESSPEDPHAVQPERPTVATHAHTVAPGWVEIESGLERDKRADGSVGLAASLQTKIGLSRHLQLGLSTPWQHREAGPGSGSGPGDVSAGIKWRLLDHSPGLGDFALLPSVKLATGSTARGTGTGTTDATLLLISSNAVGPVSLDVNAGYTRRSGNSDLAPRDATLWTVSSGFPLRGAFGGVLEIYGLPGTSGTSGERPIVALLTGPAVTPRPWLELDIGLIVPIAGPQPHALYCGFVWNLGRL